MTTQTLEFLTDAELQAASGGAGLDLLGELAGGFHSGVMANVVGIDLPAGHTGPQSLGMMLGQKSGIGK